MIDDINELVPAMRQKVVKTIVEAAKIGYRLRVVESYRTNQRQAELYAQGRTAPGSIVTNAKPGQSLHEKRRAVDFVDRQKGYDIDWQAIANLAKKQGLVWGGSFGDNPHFEYHGPESEEEVKQEEKDFEKAYVFWQYAIGRDPENHQVVLDRVKDYRRFRDEGLNEAQAWHKVYKNSLENEEPRKIIIDHFKTNGYI